MINMRNMVIMINCSTIRVGGAIQVAHSFLSHIKEDFKQEYIIVLSNTLRTIIDKEEFPSNFIFYTYDISPTPKNAIFGKNRFLDSLITRHTISKVFTIFGPAYWRPDVIHVVGFAKAQYLYKNSPYFSRLSFGKAISLSVKQFFHLWDFRRNCDILITENPDVTDKVYKKLLKPTYTVTNNYHQIFDNSAKWRPVQIPNSHKKNILSISANYPHKNLQIIPLIISELIRKKISKYRFIVTLNPGDLRTTTEIDQYIIYLGKVSIEECPSLYEQCDYMFLPTLLECFSASYAEAMKMNTPILTSDLDFAKGICDDAAIYFDPLEPEDIVEKLILLDNDSDLQDRLIENGQRRLSSFDTSATRVDKYLEIIKNS